jgi:hypothetical protein
MFSFPQWIFWSECIRKRTDSYLSCRSSHRGRGSKLQRRHKAPLASIRSTCGEDRQWSGIADLAGASWERPTKAEASRELCWSVGKTDRSRAFAVAPAASLVVRCGIHGGGKLVVVDSAWRQWDSGLCEGKVLLRAGCGEHRPIWGRRYLCSLFAFHFLKFPWL